MLSRAGVAAVSAGTVGATGTRTVTRTLASTVPPSPLAVRWKLVEVEGETVCVPLTLTVPMPSIDTAVASVVRQFSTTDWPRSIASGSAVSVAVGAGVGAVAVGPRLGGIHRCGLVLVPHPLRAAMASVSRRAALSETGCVWNAADEIGFRSLRFSCAAKLDSTFMLLKKHLPAAGVPERYRRRNKRVYFQLQFGMSAPAPVSGRCCVPSASMVQMRMCSARPSGELA